MTKSADIKQVADSILTMNEKIFKGYGVPVSLEIISTKKENLPAAMQQSLPSSRVVKAYKSGSYIGEYRWSLFLRVAVEDTNGRLAASLLLQEAAEEAENTIPVMPQGFTFYGTRVESSTPTLRDATEQYETYEVTLVTNYKRSKERK